MASSVNKINSSIVVAAIDFGTTYSGYAYSWKHDYNNDPLKIHSNKWEGEGLVSAKAPTSILFNKEEKFHSFGYEAEYKYAELADEEIHKGWHYFKRFKMELQRNKKLHRNLYLKDDQGRKMKAMKVFGESIRYLKKHLIDSLKNKNIFAGLEETLIYWVLTVPAIWKESAKQFMIEAANAAGIPSSRLTLALEPEAAAVYCKEVNAKKVLDGAKGWTPLKERDQFLIIDLGGGTADFTAHEIQHAGTLQELVPPSGGPWGGTTVDDGLVNLLEDITPRGTLKNFQENYKSQHLDMLNNFEIKKRSLKPLEPNETKNVTIKIPGQLEPHLDISGGQYSTPLIKKSDKLIIDQDGFVDITFQEAKTSIIGHLREVLATRELSRVKTLLMVGGFSVSKIISAAVREAFPELRVVIPEDADLAVVKGAVLIGRNPAAIISRRMGSTYGISTCIAFDPKEHDSVHMVMGTDGDPRCEDVFKVLMRKGQDAIPGETSAEYVVHARSYSSTIEVYKSSNDRPRYVTDDHCLKLGQIELGIVSSKRIAIRIKMLFGEERLKVVAVEEKTKKVVETYFNCL